MLKAWLGIVFLTMSMRIGSKKIVYLKRQERERDRWRQKDREIQIICNNPCRFHMTQSCLGYTLPISSTQNKNCSGLWD